MRWQVPILGIVDGFRRLQHRWSDALAELIEQHEPADDRPALRRRLLAVPPAFFDRRIDAVIGEYLAQRERLLAQQVADRRSVVLSILHGGSVPADQAGRTLGLPLGRHHLALIASLPGTSRPDAAHALDATVRRLAAALSCPSVLSVPSGEATTWIWVSREKPFPGAYSELIAQVPVEPGELHLAFGRPGEGIDGFRRSHHAAQDAAAIAHVDPGGAGLTCYADVGLLALLTVDTNRARWCPRRDSNARHPL